MTADDEDEEVRAAAIALAKGLAAFWQTGLGDRLLGAYLLGSLAHGGFNRRYSDIDIGLVTETGIAEDEIAAMRKEAARLSPELASKVSLFWADRGFSVGRFPPLDRLDYLDRTLPLVERERVRPPRPSHEEVRSYLRGAPFENWRATVARFAGLATLEPTDHKPYLRAHLYPARFAYSWLTGRMASNDDAVAWLHENPPEGLDLGLLDRALRCRHRAADPDELFPDRVALHRQVTACARLRDG